MRPLPFMFLLSSLALAACARELRNPAVIVPYQDGLIVASAMARTEQDALRHAVRGAEMECERRGAPLAVTRTTTHFRGVVSREVTETVSKIGEVVNAQAGPVMPDLSTDEDYKVNVEFRCGAAGR